MDYSIQVSLVVSGCFSLKKDGSLRMCCDFRKLNQKTIPDRHPLPKVQATLDGLGGNKFFTVLDQTRAYYQGFVAEKDRKKLLL